MAKHKPKDFVAIGIMSGSSLDGMDAVLARFQTTPSGYQTEVIEHAHRAYPQAWKNKIREISSQNQLRESAYFGALWSDSACNLIYTLLKKSKTTASEVDVIGAHGQTVVHLPKPNTFLGKKIGITIQLADLSRLAVKSQIAVVGNFRTADVALGGEGAPLVPHAHRMFFGKPGHIVAVQNMGGIGNVTLLKNHRVVLAFDTGPGNTWIDQAAVDRSRGKIHFDQGGRLASKGKYDSKIVRDLLRHPYFRKIPPKSAGWEQFGPLFFGQFLKRMKHLSLSDALATATEATAQATAQAYLRHVFPRGRPSQIIFAGGGAKNSDLLKRVRNSLHGMRITTSEDYGIPADQVEALSFALLAVQTLQGIPSNEPSATGAKKPAILGSISFP